MTESATAVRVTSDWLRGGSLSGSPPHYCTSDVLDVDRTTILGPHFHQGHGYDLPGVRCELAPDLSSLLEILGGNRYLDDERVRLAVRLGEKAGELVLAAIGIAAREFAHLARGSHTLTLDTAGHDASVLSWRSRLSTSAEDSSSTHIFSNGSVLTTRDVRSLRNTRSRKHAWLSQCKTDLTTKRGEAP